MPNIIKNPSQFIGRLLIWRAVLYVGGVMTSATLAALSGMQWATADNQTRLMVLIGIFGTVAGTIGAYIDQTAARAAKGEIPFVDVQNSLPSNPPFPGTVEKTVTAQLETKTVTTPTA